AKTRPWPGGAGRKWARTGWPECRPTPSIETLVRRVVSARKRKISSQLRCHREEPPRAGGITFIIRHLSQETARAAGRHRVSRPPHGRGRAATSFGARRCTRLLHEMARGEPGSAKPAAAIKTVATNRKAFHEFFIEDRTEAGLVLTGTEVKSLR